MGADIKLNLTNSNPDYFKVTDSQLQAGDTTTGAIKSEVIKAPIENVISTSIIAKLIVASLENSKAIENKTKSEMRPTDYIYHY